jgi:hypothetical protein
MKIETVNDQTIALDIAINALKHLVGLEAIADAVVGFVDNPHVRALRAASARAKAALKELEVK